MKSQPILRLAWSCDRDASRSSIDNPVISASRSKFLLDGKDSPVTHSLTDGCLTPIRSAKSACEVEVSESQRLSRSIQPNIGETYVYAIGRTYVPIGHASKMGRNRKSEEESFMTRALRVAAVTHGREQATVSNIANWAGVTQPSASGWTSGPKIENAVKLAQAINACVDYLYTGRGELFATPPPDEQLVTLLDYWPDLSERARGELAGIAYARATPESAAIKNVAIPKKKATLRSRTTNA